MRRSWGWCCCLAVLVVLALRAQAQDGTPAPTYPTAEILRCKELSDQGLYHEDCGRRYLIHNQAEVFEYWEVHEWALYWDVDCRIPLIPATVFSSGVRSTIPDNVADLAFDNDVDTKWSAQCIYALGGCLVEDFIHLGFHLQDDQDPIAVDQPQHEYAGIRCMKLYQSPNITRQAAVIDLQMSINDLDYEVIASYTGLTGGIWQQRPSQSGALWRVWNEEPTQAPWTVAEIIFYYDHFCQEKIDAVPLSGTNNPSDPAGFYLPFECFNYGTCDDYAAKNAFDGVIGAGQELPDPLPTVWMSACDESAGCEARGAWIGIDQGSEPRSVNCLAMYQPFHDGYPDWGTPTYTTALFMDVYSGDGSYSPWGVFEGFTQGIWNNTRPPYAMAWRLSSYDRIPEEWEVMEASFYENPDCSPGTAPGLQGTAVDSNPALDNELQKQVCRQTYGSCANLAFDHSVATYWISSCGPCGQREPWIGILLRRPYEDIQCFKIYQSSLYERQSAAIELSMWIGQTWRAMRLELSVGGGTWNARPTQPGSMLRLLGQTSTEEPWALSGLALYTDTQCNDLLELSDLYGPTAITCGYAEYNSVLNAFNVGDEGAEESHWVASCVPESYGSTGCAPSVAWLGLQNGTMGTMDIKCMRLRQGRRKATQMATVVVQVWDGVRWNAFDAMEPYMELGGGAWQMLPGRRGSMWRLWMTPIPGNVGVGVSEIELYSSPDCSAAGLVPAGYPNKMPICSAYATSQEIKDATGYEGHLQNMGVYGLAYPEYAFDGDLSTFWADISPDISWVGLDLTTATMDVKCVRMAFAYMKTMQPGVVEVQAWDGNVWTSEALSTSTQWHHTLRWDVPYPSMLGMAQRPLLTRRAWRLENGNTVPDWEVYDIELHTLGDCGSTPLTGLAISSAQDTAEYVAAGGHLQPQDAFDGDLLTSWSADCSQEGGCTPGQAWIGLQVDVAVKVLCVRIAQSKMRARQIDILIVSSWEGDRWVNQDIYWGGGLGGEGWNQRPVGSDAMWRVVFEARQDEECSTFLPAPYKRAWGVSELQFFADDDCLDELPGAAQGAVPITSGSRELEVSAATLAANPNARYAYVSGNAFDGTIDTRWSAECPGPEDAPCEPGMEWIGLDFTRATGGLPVQVQCFKIHQSRYSAQDCCDPAEQVQLERWNGSTWVPAIWRHEPIEKDTVYVTGQYENLGPCPSSAEVSGSSGDVNELLWEEWPRRLTAECEIPVSGAVRLLSDELCEKHPKCVEAGEVGLCCPFDIDAAISKCCCDFLIAEALFEDEMEIGIDREPVPTTPAIGLEKLIIQASTVMPWIGLLVGVVFWCVVLMPQPDPCRSDTVRFKVYVWFCLPAHRWMDKVEPLSYPVALLVKPVPGERMALVVVKRVLFLVFSVLAGACFIWTVGAIIIAWIMLKCTSALGLIIRYAKSPFKFHDKKRLCAALGIPFATAEQTKNRFDTGLGDLVVGVGMSWGLAVTYCIKCVFDLILLRFAAMNAGLVDITLPVPEVLAYVPKLPFNLDALSLVLYDMTQISAEFFQGFYSSSFSGVPRCQGPVLIVSGMWLIAITLVLVRWLNYDYFGLFFVTRDVVKKTRPMFQKAMLTGILLGMQTAMFITMQCVMLMFSRALLLVDVQSLFSESDQWQCPYEGEEMTVIVGKTFIFLTASMAVGVTFLCANGHFMGQDYIVREFSGMLQMDLSRLDPDGVGDDGGVIRMDTGLAMIPTTFGLWFDWWNVDGFLIQERADVYSKELHYPEVCEVCGENHVPYALVMRATSKQVSLAYQLVPFGAILGKACEYCNDPPLLYCGSKLKCYYHNKNLKKARSGLTVKPSKMPWGRKKVLYYVGLFIAGVKDILVPILIRVMSVLMYVVLLYFVLKVDHDNLEAVATQFFSWLFLLSIAKAVFELALPVLLLIGLGALMVYTARQAKKPPEGVNRKLPWLGQLLHGYVPGAAAAVYVAQHPDYMLESEIAAYIGIGVGLVFSWIALTWALVQENLADAKIFTNLVWLVYNTALAYFSVKYCVWDMDPGKRWVVVAGLWVILIPLTSFAFKPLRKDSKFNAESQILPLMTQIYALPGLLGVASAIFAMMQGLKPAQDNLGDSYGLGVMLAFGFCAGLAFTLASEKLLKSDAGKWALIISVGISAVIALLWEWAPGVFIGGCCGSAYGTYLERAHLQKVKGDAWEEASKKAPTVISRIPTRDQPGFVEERLRRTRERLVDEAGKSGPLDPAGIEEAPRGTFVAPAAGAEDGMRATEVIDDGAVEIEDHTSSGSSRGQAQKPLSARSPQGSAQQSTGSRSSQGLAQRSTSDGHQAWAADTAGAADSFGPSRSQAWAADDAVGRASVGPLSSPAGGIAALSPAGGESFDNAEGAFPPAGGQFGNEPRAAPSFTMAPSQSRRGLGNDTRRQMSDVEHTMHPQARQGAGSPRAQGLGRRKKYSLAKTKTKD